MIPVVTEASRPKGEPMATTVSPTTSASLTSRIWMAGRSSRSTRITARSLSGSVPMTSASSTSPDASRTATDCASPTTWLLVRM